MGHPAGKLPTSHYSMRLVALLRWGQICRFLWICDVFRPLVAARTMHLTCCFEKHKSCICTTLSAFPTVTNCFTFYLLLLSDVFRHLGNMRFARDIRSERAFRPLYSGSTELLRTTPSKDLLVLIFLHVFAKQKIEFRRCKMILFR